MQILNPKPEPNNDDGCWCRVSDLGKRLKPEFNDTRLSVHNYFRCLHPLCLVSNTFATHSNTLATHSQHISNTFATHSQHIRNTFATHSQHTATRSQHIRNTFATHSQHIRNTLATHSQHISNTLGIFAILIRFALFRVQGLGFKFYTHTHT
jgi:hypothetical protein